MTTEDERLRESGDRAEAREPGDAGRGWARAIGRHLRHNIYGLLALFVALSGTAYANFKVGPGDIQRNAVRAKHVGKQQIRARHVARNAIAARHIAPRAIRGRHFAPGSIQGSFLADGTITPNKLGRRP